MSKETDYTLLSDQQLVVLIGQDDYDAFNALYIRHIEDLLNYSRRLHIDEDESNDFVQEVFASVWTRRHCLKLDEPIAWLYMSVKKQMLQNLRKQQYRDKYIKSIATYLTPFYDPILDQIQEKQVREFIENEISKLPPKMQQIFKMSRQDYLSHKEIAEHLQLSEKTVRKQISNALKIFRSKISYREAELIVLLSYLLSK